MKSRVLPTLLQSSTSRGPARKGHALSTSGDAHEAAKGLAAAQHLHVLGADDSG